MEFEKPTLLQDPNLFNYGCSSVKEASVHFDNVYAASAAYEESNKKYAKSNTDTQSSPSGSTASQSQGNHSSSAAHNSGADDWKESIIPALCVKDDEEKKVDNVLNKDYTSVGQERSAAPSNGMVVEAFTGEEEEQGEEAEGEADDDECQYNKMEVEPEEHVETGEIEEAKEMKEAEELEVVEETKEAEDDGEAEEFGEVGIAELEGLEDPEDPEDLEADEVTEEIDKVEEVKEVKEDEEEKKKSIQSIYKNKPKELLERAAKILNYFKALQQSEFDMIVTVSEKSEEEWLREGEELKKKLNQFESHASSVQKNKIKESILKDLKGMQYYRFAELFYYQLQIKEHESTVTTNFNNGYKNKVSQKFFKRAIESRGLFDWVLLLQIASILIPSDAGVVELFHLRKDTASFCTWIIESKMDQDNKDLFKTAKVRNHLRDVLTKALDDVWDQAKKKLPSEELTLLTEIRNKLNQRSLLRVTGSRAVPKELVSGDMTGKRSSRKAQLPTIDTKTKKVNGKAK